MNRYSRYDPPLACVFCLCYAAYFTFFYVSTDEFLRMEAISFSTIAAIAFAIAWQTDNDIRRLIQASTQLANSIQNALNESRIDEDRNKV